MEADVLKTILESENGWIAIVLFTLFIIFKIGIRFFDNRKSKTKAQALESMFAELRINIIALKDGIKNSKTKDGIIESIERRLKILSNQYSSVLSREAAVSTIQNIYFNFSTILINEIVELKERNIAVNSLIAIIKTRISILNDDKMQELELFLYKNKELITFTSGDIINTEAIIEIINSYGDKNGMLAREVRTHIEIEMNQVIKRLY